MTASAKPLAEITAEAIRVLCREIGPVNTARFLNQFSAGLGNYTQERDKVLGNPSVDDLLAEIRARKKNGPTKAARKSPRR
jgi:hypothetical protein